ncbi:hypothetical protein [Delftia sp. PS-11]|uniref:hypothetical protein n=1 Tax=Delftia sp. PS-11 TaxID=2767222 RepID=UPI002453B505|nr:hypothetical protein [Delftia sp. PS-11]
MTPAVSPAAQGNSGCGSLGKIIMVAVAVVAAVYTAGALAPAAASAGTGFGATMTTGASVLGGGASLSTGSAFAIGAASGAAGSIASQAAGNLLGMQDSFSWKGVALSALSAGVSGGLTTSSLLGGSSLDKLLLRSVAGNALTQGAGIVTGLQSSFDWRGVASSAAGTVAGQAAGKLLGDAVGASSGDPWAKEMLTRTGAGLAAGTVASIAQGGRISLQQVATDAFGNALGWSVAEASLPPASQRASADSKPDWLADMKAWRSVPGVQLAQNMTGAMITSQDDSASTLGITLPQTAPVLPEIVVRATKEEGWSNPFADPALSAAQWTVSNITSIARGTTVEQLASPNLDANAQLIRTTQGPSNGNILQKVWNSPDVQGAAQRSGVGALAAGAVQSLGEAWAGATGYNPVSNQYYSPLEQQQAMWGTVASIVPLGAGVKILGAEKAVFGNAGSAAPVAGAVDAAGETVTVFRVQGGTPPLASRQLITIDANGNPVISKTTLNVSVGDPVHAEYFLSKRPGADITSFDVPKWMGDFIEEQAIPQVGYRTNPANQGGLAPKLVDPTTPGRSYELPDVWAKWLEEVAVPGSGRVKKGGTP